MDRGRTYLLVDAWTEPDRKYGGVARRMILEMFDPNEEEPGIHHVTGSGPSEDVEPSEAGLNPTDEE